jgi:predicted CoA-binding protein
MPGFDGTGPRGMGPMTGCGRGYCVIPLNTPEQEHDFLKSQAKALREELEQIEARIDRLELLRAEPAVRSK